MDSVISYHKRPQECAAYRRTYSDQNRIRIKTGLESQKIMIQRPIQWDTERNIQEDMEKETPK